MQCQFYEKLNSGSNETKGSDAVEEKDGNAAGVSFGAVDGEVDGVAKVSLDVIKEKVSEKVSDNVDTSSDHCVKDDEIASASQKIPEAERSITMDKETGNSRVIPQSTNIEALLEEEMAELRDERQVLVSLSLIVNIFQYMNFYTDHNCKNVRK